MRITSIQPELIREIPFLNAGRGPGGFYRDTLPVHHGFVDQLPKGMSAIIATADLQGRETFESSGGKPIRLLGEVLPSLLAQKIIPNLGIGEGRSGVLLAGDFYTVPALDKRGGSGDVTSVWHAFFNSFDWVVGVAGNHDLFGDAATRPRFPKPMHFLDNDNVLIEGLASMGESMAAAKPFTPDNITFCIKTIHRPWGCHRLVQSLRKHFEQPKIVVVDDGRPELRFSEKYPDTAKHCRVIDLDRHDVGVGVGRNTAIDAAETEFIFLLDDDHVITPDLHAPRSC